MQRITNECKHGKLSNDYNEILNLLENLNDCNMFKSFEKKIQIQDGILNLFNTIYFLLSDIEDIKTNKNIISDMFGFKNFLNKYRSISIIQRAIELGASMEYFSYDEFMQLIDLKDKDINIVLSSNKYINDDIAHNLIDPLYIKFSTIYYQMTY